MSYRDEWERSDCDTELLRSNVKAWFNLQDLYIWEELATKKKIAWITDPILSLNKVSVTCNERKQQEIFKKYNFNLKCAVEE